MCVFSLFFRHNHVTGFIKMLNSCFLFMQGPELMNKYVGESERAVDDGLFLAELSKVVAERVELDFGIVLSLGGSLGFHLTGDDLLLLGLCADADACHEGKCKQRYGLLHRTNSILNRFAVQS